MSKSSINTHLIFCVKNAFSDGGMPNDIRQFIAGNLAVNNCKVSLITNSKNSGKHENLDKLNIITAFDIKDIFRIELASITPETIFIFIGYSSFYNLMLSLKLRWRGYNYAIIPSWQIHPFLDLDNPFEKTTVPSISNLTQGIASEGSPIIKRVRNGNPNLYSYLNSLKRRIYRYTLGRFYISGASKIFVFSEYEKNNILRYFSIDDYKFKFIHFGANLNYFKYGGDTFPKDGCLNIIYWGRVDFFYKGLDTILNSISLAKDRGVRKKFKLWICGPDYNEGYSKVRNYMEKSNLYEYVEILSPGDYTPGTIDLLKDADFSISSPKWDGFSRSMRESLCLGVPIISNLETHFDQIIKKFNNGLIFKNSEELSEIFQNLDSEKICDVQIAAKEQQAECEEFFQWKQAANIFQSTFKN